MGTPCPRAPLPWAIAGTGDRYINKTPHLARVRRSWVRRAAVGGMQAGPSNRRGMERVRPGAGGCYQQRQLFYRICIGDAVVQPMLHVHGLKGR